jgi:hypothetical protein
MVYLLTKTKIDLIEHYSLRMLNREGFSFYLLMLRIVNLLEKLTSYFLGVAANEIGELLSTVYEPYLISPKKSCEGCCPTARTTACTSSEYNQNEFTDTHNDFARLGLSTVFSDGGLHSA